MNPARRGALLALCALGAGAVARPAWAHRSHVTLTRVTANPRARSWEFVTALHFHDAVRVLALRSGDASLQATSAQGRAYLLLEVERGLRWRSPDGTALEPTPVGVELEGDSILVYQELPAPGAAGRYAVESTLLHDVFDSQANTISIELAEPTQALRLDARRVRGEFTAGGGAPAVVPRA